MDGGVLQNLYRKFNHQTNHPHPVPENKDLPDPPSTPSSKHS